MEKIDVYNSEKEEIKVVTEYETVIIPPGCSRLVKVDEKDVFGTGDFYIEGEGEWYIKTEHCHTLCDAEIYRADTE